MPLCKSMAMYIASAGPQRVRKVSAKLRDVSIALKKCGRDRVRSLSLAWAILFTAVSSANNLIHNCCRFERNCSTHDNDYETDMVARRLFHNPPFGSTVIASQIQQTKVYRFL